MTPAGSAPRDRFSARFVVAILALLSGTVIINAYHLSLWSLFLLLLVALISTAAGFVLLIVSFWKRRWRRVLSIAATPLLAGALISGWEQAGMSPALLRLLV